MRWSDTQHKVIELKKGRFLYSVASDLDDSCTVRYPLPAPPCPVHGLENDKLVRIVEPSLAMRENNMLMPLAVINDSLALAYKNVIQRAAIIQNYKRKENGETKEQLGQLARDIHNLLKRIAFEGDVS
ncbi:hypothetical protein PoB_001960600 [Plakobranchus ocellatus]|uniref:Uncharacterized protein n=1 Tax=Plakobranchus ocellatus TaxID=259542 RepID=A0AAV3ZEP9_9GAST|nr:hypothetical protein PoB_001960600 [Plakobranchus ocellatus]